jgi:hypothetical protein
MIKGRSRESESAMPDEKPKLTITRAIGVACDSIIVQIVRFLAFIGISPNALTAIGLGINIYAAWLLSKGNFFGGDWSSWARRSSIWWMGVWPGPRIRSRDSAGSSTRYWTDTPTYCS